MFENHMKKGFDMRGCIEVVSKSVVSGWIYNAEISVRGRLVLAICGTRCVGSGVIDYFRADINAAGLGDGFAGFHFPIHLRSEQMGQLVVKLEGSDFVLLQRNASLSVPVLEIPKGS